MLPTNLRQAQRVRRVLSCFQCPKNAEDIADKLAEKAVERLEEVLRQVGLRVAAEPLQ